jgi:hypothetical protein
MPTTPTPTPSTPLSPAISQALTRCGVAHVGTWEVQLLAAVDRARVAQARNEAEDARGIVEVKAQLDLFLKALDRGTVPGPGAILKHWERLDGAGRLFVERELARLDPKVSRFDELNLDVDGTTLRTAIGAARRKFGGKPGRRSPMALRDLVMAVATIYQHCTGKKAGISSSSAAPGMHYLTPFEELLEATLAEAGHTYKVEALRSLIRSALRDRPKISRAKMGQDTGNM